MPLHRTPGARARVGTERRPPGTLERTALPPYRYAPRPDPTANGRVWPALLEPAFRLDGDAPAGRSGALHGVRCHGARLGPATGDIRPGRGHRIVPGADHPGGSATQAADRARWLLPRADVLTPLLAGRRAEAYRPPVKTTVERGDHHEEEL